MYNDSCEFLRVSSLYQSKFPYTFCLLRIIILPHGITVSHCLVSRNLKMCILSFVGCFIQDRKPNPCHSILSKIGNLKLSKLTWNPMVARFGYGYLVTRFGYGYYDNHCFYWNTGVWGLQVRLVCWDESGYLVILPRSHMALCFYDLGGHFPFQLSVWH